MNNMENYDISIILSLGIPIEFPLKHLTCFSPSLMAGIIISMLSPTFYTQVASNIMRFIPSFHAGTCLP